MMGRESTPWTEFYWGGTDGGGLLPGGGGDFLAKALDPEGPPPAPTTLAGAGSYIAGHTLYMVACHSPSSFLVLTVWFL